MIHISCGEYVANQGRAGLIPCKVSCLLIIVANLWCADIHSFMLMGATVTANCSQELIDT